MVKSWMNGTYVNNGFILKEPSETNSSQKTKFYSSDAPSPNKPELVINYSSSNSLTYWESDQDVIRRWSSTPSIYTAKLNSNPTFYFAAGITHARSEWSV